MILTLSTPVMVAATTTKLIDNDDDIHINMVQNSGSVASSCEGQLTLRAKHPKHQVAQQGYLCLKEGQGLGFCLLLLLRRGPQLVRIQFWAQKALGFSRPWIASRRSTLVPYLEGHEDSISGLIAPIIHIVTQIIPIIHPLTKSS